MHRDIFAITFVFTYNFSYSIKAYHEERNMIVIRASWKSLSNSSLELGILVMTVYTMCFKFKEMLCVAHTSFIL